MTLLIMAICTVVWKALYNFKIKRAQEARHNQFFFQNIQNNEILRSSKFVETTVELTFTTQNANTCSPWTTCSVFNWKYLFLGKFGPKIQNYQFKLKFCTYTNSNMQNSMVMFTFPVFDWKILFFGKSGQKIKIVSLT